MVASLEDQFFEEYKSYTSKDALSLQLQTIDLLC